MNRVVTAVEQGRCALAVSGSLLNDADVLLALKDRAAMPAMALAGPATPPVVPVTEAAVARTIGGPGGVIVIVNPQASDMTGLQQLARILERAPHKPTILVAAQQYNPLLFGSVFRGVAVAHLKARGKDFIVKDLPIPPAGVEAPAGELAPKQKAKAGGGPEGPRFAFVGRDEEMEQLGQMLGSGGPIVVSGAAGIGKTWLVEHALAKAGLKRLPDLVLGWGTDADALFARLAVVCKENGSSQLYDVLKGAHTPAQAVQAAVASLQEAAGTDGKVMVVHDLHHALGRDEDFFRKSRLELLLEALLTNTYPLRLVFTSRQQPVFHRERAGESLRRLEVGGLKGRFLHEIFDAYKAPEFPRERFGPISEKIHGSPMAARQYAIEVRDNPDGVELTDDPKFLKMESAADTAGIKRLLEKKVESLAPDERHSLAVIAHFRLTIAGSTLNDIGVSRQTRMKLMAYGLLDMIGTAEEKRYGVHALVRGCLPIRETSDFDILGRMAELYARFASQTEDPIEKLALQQEANRNAILGRALRARIKMDLPDDDATLETVAGMIRSKKPNFDLARQRLAEVLNSDPSNSDAHLYKIELLSRAEADKDTVEAAIAEAAEKAPVPEVFHQGVSFHLHRRARGKAATLMEKAVEILPDQSRLRTRLAALLLRQGRRKEAIEQLQTAMAIDPMLPDAYGLLGTARRDEGVEALDEAENLLREAVRLAPGDATQISRLVDLLVARARVDAARQRALRDEAKELLDRVLKSERKSPDAYLLYAALVREDTGDLERAAWLLKKAKKLTERGHERNWRIGLEGAQQALLRGELDQAEKDVRELANKDMSNHTVFAALAQVLEAKQLYIPAHAEYLRARDRAPKGSVEAQWYDQQLSRLQALIEAQVANMAATGEVAFVGEAAPAPAPEAAPHHNRVIRRRRGTGGEAAGEGQEGEASPEGQAAEGQEAEGQEAEAGDTSPMPDAIADTGVYGDGASEGGDDGEGAGASSHLYDDEGDGVRAEGEGEGEGDDDAGEQPA